MGCAISETFSVAASWKGKWTGTAATDGWVNSDVKVGSRMHSSEPWIIEHGELDWKCAFTGLKAGFASSMPLPVVTQDCQE